MGGVFDDIVFRPSNRKPEDSHDHAVLVGDPDRCILHLVGTCARCTWLNKQARADQQ